MAPILPPAAAGSALIRRFILAFSLLATLLFGSALVATYVNPLLIESAAREVVRGEVEKRVGERIRRLDESKIADIAGRMARRHDGQIAEIRRQMAQGLPQRVAAVVADMRRVDCECRKKIEAAMVEQFERRLATLTQWQDNLTALIQAKYMDVAAQLTREFRIFTAANAMVFALLAATAWLRRGAGIQLLLPVLVLAGSAVIVGTLYLVGQNWLHTIVFSSYVGLGYFAYLGVAVALLSDVVFNRARVSTGIANALGSVCGVAVNALPC